MNTFKKEERICSKILLEKLFSGGKSFICFPLRVTFLAHVKLEKYPAQVVFIVSKKRFKKANRRNLIKRRMRESYRTNKSTLYDYLNNNKVNIVLSINYVGTGVETFISIDKQIQSAIQKIVKLLSGNNTHE